MQPFQIDDLSLVSAEHAAYCILMYPDNAEDLTVSTAPAKPPSGQKEAIADAQEDRDLQQKSNVEALNAMTIAALSTFDAFSRQNLVVQVRGRGSP